MFKMLRRIQYSSCLYVDNFEKVVGAHFVKPAAKVLVLNGNIGKLTSFQTQAFIQHCSRLWHTVLYVPGSYELGQLGRPVSFGLPNVHFLHNSSVFLHGYQFIGSPYISEEDRKWVQQEYNEYRHVPEKTIVLSHMPEMSFSLLDRLNLCAWISGSTIGGTHVCLGNGTQIAYNARGSICGINDFSGDCGWRRDATLTVRNLG